MCVYVCISVCILMDLVLVPFTHHETLGTLTCAVSGFIIYKTEIIILHKTVVRTKRSNVCIGPSRGRSRQVGVITEALSQV